MTTEKKTVHTHWKQLINYDYLGAYSLEEGKDLTVTIVDIKKEPVKGEGGRVDECVVAYLNNQKPMILNRTNCKRIAAIYKTPYIEDWKGKQITVYVDNTSLRGEMVECLRVRSAVPALPDLTPTSVKWAGAIAALKKGSHTIAQIEKLYTLTPENRELLLTAAI